MTYEPSAELANLLGALLEDEITPEESDRLAEILADDPDARAFYRELIETHSLLVWQQRSAVSPIEAFTDEGLAPTAAECIAPPIVLASSIHGTLGYLSSGWPTAYLVATVILGVGMLVGASLHVSQPEQTVRKSDSLHSPLSPLPSPRMQFVGQITGMIDCEWADVNTAVPGPVAVPLGRKYALASGLMEITYDTGAKVILQGPCTYEVESPASGYLSLGKLTARVEKKATNLPSPFGRGAGGEGGGKNEELSDSRSSFFIPHSYFAVRTPTATVTDLGTEFGVEVLEDGRSEVHVLRGLVETKFADAGTNGDRKVRVAAGEAVRLDRGRLVVEHFDANPAAFVRTVAQPARALPALIVADNFAYPDGPLDGNNGGSAGAGSFWSGAWFRGGSVIGGQVVLTESRVVSRMLHPAIAGSSTQPIYFSARFTKTGTNPKYESCVQLVADADDTTTTYHDATIGLHCDQYWVVLSGGTLDRVKREAFGVYTPGQQVLIVGKLVFNVDGANDRLQAWVNPTGVETADVVSSQLLADLRWTTPRCVHLRNWTGQTGTCLVSDLRIGYTWNAVVGPSNIPVSKEESRIDEPAIEKGGSKK